MTGDMTDAGFASRPRRASRLVGIATLLVLVVGVHTSPVHAEDRVRVDTYDQHGNRTGHVIVDKQTGRVDAYDTSSRHLPGYGKIAPDGRVDVFGKDGRRIGSGRPSDPGALTSPPKARGAR